jgi:hypothetical protein
MMTQLLGLAFLAVLYGLAWHNRPAREHDRSQDAENRTQ